MASLTCVDVVTVCGVLLVEPETDGHGYYVDSLAKPERNRKKLGSCCCRGTEVGSM